MDYFSYFLFCLMRYPLFCGDVKTSQQLFTAPNQPGGGMSPVDCLHRFGVSKWTEGAAYLTLVQDFIRHYFRESSSSRSSNGGASSSSRRQTDSSDDSSDRLNNEATLTKQRRRELLVRLAIEFWIDLGCVVRFNHHKVASYREQLSSFNTVKPAGPFSVTNNLVAATLYQHFKGKLYIIKYVSLFHGYF